MLMNSGFKEGFNTLEFNGTTLQKPMITVMGEGTDLTDFDALESKAKRKLITQTMALSLIEVAKLHHDWKWEQRFWNTHNCQSEIVTVGGRSYAIYCGNRCCTICLANRKAEKINLYLPELQTWPDPYFLTLTVQSVTKEHLRLRIYEVAEALRRIIAMYKKRYQRGTEANKFYGMWSLECNFNAIERTYNPHLHLILPNLYVTETLLLEWLLYWDKKSVPISGKAQHYRNLRSDRTEDLIEIVKYGSKIFTEPDLKNKINVGNTAFIYTAALYNILRAMDRHHVFNTFGFKLTNPTQPYKKSTTVSEYTEWEYDRSVRDWVSYEYKRGLTDYRPPKDLEELLEYRVNTDLE